MMGQENHPGLGCSVPLGGPMSPPLVFRVSLLTPQPRQCQQATSSVPQHPSAQQQHRNQLDFPEQLVVKKLCLHSRVQVQADFYRAGCMQKYGLLTTADKTRG